MTPRWLLLYTLIIFNTCAAAAAWAAYKMGFIDRVLVPGVPYAISALFLAGFVSAFWHGFRLSRAINEHAKSPWRGREKTRDVEKMEVRQSFVHWVENALFILGLIGTVLGLILMVGDPNATTAARAVAVYTGLGVALPSALMSFVLALWTSFNGLMLDKAVQIHLADVRP